MHKTQRTIALMLLSVSAARAATDRPPALEWVETTPQPSDDILFNPGMGLYLQHPPLDAEPDEWFMQAADIAYYRLHWADVNPEEGQYTFNCGQWRYKPYARRGVICNFEVHSSYTGSIQQDWSPTESIQSGLDAPVSYMNMNWFGGASVREAPEEGRRLLIDAAKKLGYRFVMTRLTHLPKLGVDGRRPGRVPLVGTWRNDGIAPCYESLCIEWTLLDAQGAVVASELTFPETPTTQWWPGEEVEVTAMLRVPAGTAEGRYVLKVAASAHLAIEKGAYSTPIRATIRLDDVKLELIESP